MEASVANGGPAGVEGGGGEAPENGGAPQQSFINLPDDTPAELQPLLQQYIQQNVDPQVTRKFEEAAQLRKQFEPLAGVEGLTDMHPEDIEGMVALGQRWQTPEDFHDWIAEAAIAEAKEHPDAIEAVWTQMGQELGYFDDPEGPEGEPGEADPQVAQLTGKIEQLEQQLQGFVGKQEQTERVSQASQQIDQQFAEIDPEGKMDDDTRQDVMMMALGMTDEENPIKAAHERILRHKGQAQGELVDEKLGQPEPANQGGQPASGAEAFTGFGDPKLKDAMLARVRGS